jgi:hypothetical protein
MHILHPIGPDPLLLLLLLQVSRVVQNVLGEELVLLPAATPCFLQLTVL